MVRILTSVVFVLASTLLYAQEICNNGIDDDNDGFIDCYDGSCANDPACDGIFLGNNALCQAIPTEFPKFEMALDFSSPDQSTNHFARMAIGDLDRDGFPEIITMNRYTDRLFILDGRDGSVKFNKQANLPPEPPHIGTTTFEPYWEIAIANIDDDNCGEIFFIGYLEEESVTTGPRWNRVKTVYREGGIYMFAYDCQLNFLWRTEEPLPDDPINYGLTDFDGDGKVEIYAKDEIYDAHTGVRIVKTTASDYREINGGPVAVDIVGDIRQELVIGLAIYQVNLGTRTKDSGSLALLKDRSEYFIRNVYNATSVADYNEDGFLDVIASGSTIDHDRNTTIFYWDVLNDTIKTYRDNTGDYAPNGWKNGTGRVNIADLDGDGGLNVSYVSGKYLYALDEKLNLLWRTVINEETSGYTGCTLFDFNGDGKSEIVYRDERYLYIIDGTDGSIFNQKNCISRTNREYPIVADVDADGSTELCVTCGFNDANALANFNTASYSRFSHVRVFKSGGEPWVPARRVWNQHGYFVVNVNDDLTVPKVLQKHHQVFSTGTCTLGPHRPLNKFLNQSPYLDSNGCTTFAASDLAFANTATISPPTCPNLEYTVAFKITNHGDVDIDGNVPVSFYDKNPLKAGATKLSTIVIPVSNLGIGDTLDVSAVVAGNGSDSLYVVLNDAGTSLPTPIKLPNTSFLECDYENIFGAAVQPVEINLTALEVASDDQCSTLDDGAVRAFVAEAGGVENTSDYDFYWSDGGVAKPIASADFQGPIYTDRAAGEYTVYAIHKTSNCSSDTTRVTVNLITDDPIITLTVISDQTVCDPPNGVVQAEIVGGITGYTFEWFDISLNPLGLSTDIADNLTAGNYVVRVSKNACSKLSDPITVAGPQIPDAQAQVLQHVVDCGNLNSGSVTGQALFNGVVQDPADFTFDWYFYNNISGTQGSILPPIHGTGATRTGLPAGFYQLEITRNSTQCKSTVLPVVEVELQTQIPVAQITEIAPQTSCDPNQPNGILKADAFIGGVLQDPATITFEWFKGSNTLPANLVSTVSGTNGQIVNNVAGGGIPYTVKVTTTLNCSGTEEEIVSENIINPVLALSSTPNSICDPALAASTFNGTITGTVTFDGNPVALPNGSYSFTWHNGPLLSDPTIATADPTNPTLTGVNNGDYLVVVERTDLNCESAPVLVNVANAKILPALSTSSTGSNNCDPGLTPDGTVTVAVTNAVPGDVFAFEWYDGNAVNPINVLAPAQNFDQATAIAVGGPVGAPNDYTVLVTNETTGCQNNATQFVPDASVVPVISFPTILPNSICSPATSFSGSVTAQVNNQVGPIGDYAFTWHNGGAVSDPVNGSSTGTFLGTLDAGFYAVTTINTVTGCESSPAVAQVPNAKILPAITMSSTGSNNCDPGLTPDGTITATVTNVNPGDAFSFLWHSGNAVDPLNVLTPAQNFNQQTAIQVGGPTGAPNPFTVLVTNTVTGCANNSTGLVADVSEKPTLTLVTTDNGICDASLIQPGPGTFNGRMEVTVVNHPAIGGSAISYDWFDVDQVTSVITGPNLTSTNSVLPNLDDGKYAVTVTIDDLGCVSDPVIDEVLDNVTLPNIATNTVASTNCDPALADGVAEVTTVDGTAVGSTTDFRYQWFDGATVDPVNIRVGDTNALLGNNLQGGVGSIFTVQVTNITDGCQNNVAVNVPDNRVIPTIAVSKVQDNTICDVIGLVPDGELTSTVFMNGVDQGTPLPGNFVVTWSTATNGQTLSNLVAATYTASVTNTSTGCISTDDSGTILNNLTYPVIDVAVTDQTSCVGSNGILTASVGGAANPATHNFTWFDGIGTGGPVHAQSGTGIINNLVSSDYTIEVRILTTGCTATRSEFVPDNIVNPAIASFANVQPVTVCNSASGPNGQAEMTISGLSFLPDNDFTIFYVETFAGGTFPTDPAVIIGSPTNTYTNPPGVNYNPGTNPPPYTGLAPGYLTSLVRDNNTGCDSNPTTVQIIDATETYAITIDGTTNAGFCGGVGGGVEVTVERSDAPGLACSTCTYEWYNATPINSNINFFNNPPNMGGAPQEVLVSGPNNEDLGAPGAPPGVGSGTYTLVVVDTDPAHEGCGNYFVESIGFVGVPVVTINPTDVTRCAVPFDGAVDITVTGASGFGYDINIYNASGPIGAPIASVAAQPSPVNLNVPGLTSSTYYIEVIDNNPTNVACPQGNIETLDQNAYAPLISITQIDPNTSCDPANTGNGRVNLTVTKDALDTTVPNYEITNISPLPIGFGALPSAVGPSGSSTGLINGFEPVPYTFTIRDIVSACQTNAVVNVPDQPDVPTGIAANVSDEEFCAPLSNASAVINSVVPATTADYDFEWYTDNALATPSFSAPGNGVGTGGELLNSVSAAPGTWAFGAAGQGSGDRIFFVRGRKNNGSGIDCYTPVIQVDVPDVHVAPDISLTPQFNSSCLVLVSGEGSIDIVASTASGNPAISGATYAYAWAPDPNTQSPQVGQPANFTIPNLGTATFTVSATNEINGCIISNSTAIQQAPFDFIISQAQVIQEQLICDPDGRIDVTQIVIDRSAASQPNLTFGAPLLADFDFEWFRANPATPGTFSPATPLLDAGSAVINEENLGINMGLAGVAEYPTMGAGTYYVVATRRAGMTPGEGCQTLPLRIEIEDQHENPIVTLTPFTNTSCDPALFEGEIEVRVTDGTNPIFGPFTFDYSWTATNIPGNAPPASAANNGNGTNDGDADHITGLQDDIYNITVVNPSSGCQGVATTTILKNVTPVFIQDVTALDQILCSPDGSLNVVSVSLNDRNGVTQSSGAGDFPISDFEFTWDKPSIAFTQTTAGTLLNNVNYPAIGFGEYFVTATRVTGAPGNGCLSAPFKVDIRDQRIFPVATLTPFSNTSCTVLSPEGEITVDVVDGSAAPGPFTYTYAWAGPTVIPAALPGTNDGDGDGSDGDEDHPLNLLEGAYTLTVTNNTTSCQSTATTTLFQNSTPVFVASGTAVPQVICLPDGQMEVTQVVVTDRNGVQQVLPPNDFDFNWYRGDPTTLVALTSGALGAIPGGSILDASVYPTIGFDTYYVDATRVNGTPGLGCASTPFRIDINDNRVFPVVQFTSVVNSSCSVLKPNGMVTAFSAEPNGTNIGPYTFAWQHNGGPVSGLTTQTDTNNSSELADALDGNYFVTSVNTVTGCSRDATFDLLLDQTRSTANVIDLLTVDPLDCNPSGSATVTRITIGSATNSILVPPNPNNEVTGAGLLAYTFEWSQGTPGNILPGEVLPTLNTILPGTYFVFVQDPTTDCKSGPKEVEILDTDIVYPVVGITQTAPQISCDNTFGTAVLVSTGDGQNDTNPDYAFTWFPTLDLTGGGFANTSTITGLFAGDYSVEVHNNITNCSASAFFIVPEKSPQFLPDLLLSSRPRTLCNIADGSVIARAFPFPVTGNPADNYPFPYDYTADLYIGATPNLSSPDFPNMSNDPANPTLTNTFLEPGLPEGVYTVRLTDNNTRCQTVKTVDIQDLREYPDTDIELIAPVTNCDPARANGVAKATVRGSFLGYRFEWCEGSTVSGTPVYIGVENSKLKAEPLQYTIFTTDLENQCTSQTTTSFEDGTLPIPIPNIEIVSHVTSCITGNGMLGASVGDDKNTRDYIFDWYDGSQEAPPSDFIGEFYGDLDAGTYSVTATSRITGCKSPLKSEEILIKQLFPEFDFTVQNTVCGLSNGFAGVFVTNDADVGFIEWSLANSLVGTGPNLINIDAGTYTATVTTVLGCVTSDNVDVGTEVRPHNGISRSSTPGQNDFFYIDCIDNFPFNIVKVFNRAGTLVYEMEGYNNFENYFDGKSNRGVSPLGNDLPDGTYFFIIDKRDGSKPIPGYLEIVR